MKRHLGVGFWSLLFVTVFLTTPASAETLLIDCDLPIGPYHQVHIVAQTDGLKLREFKRNGEIIQRELMPWEWTSKRVKLTAGRLNDVVLLQKVRMGWALRVDTWNFKYFGAVDCDHHH